MNIIKIWNDNASERQLHDIAMRLKEGEIAIIPTDTMYGIVGDALNMKAVERICRLKGINPEKTNLSIICHDISMAAEYSRIDNRVQTAQGVYTGPVHIPVPLGFNATQGVQKPQDSRHSNPCVRI